MTECIHCKRRDPKNHYCQESPNEKHYLRDVPFDEQVRTTFLGKYWKQTLIVLAVFALLSWLGII